MDEQREELEQIIEMINQYREQNNQIYAQLNLVSESIDEHRIARETIKRYKDTEQGSEALIPIGGNVYIKANVSADKKVILGIGANYTMEKSIDECIDSLNSRISALESGRDKLSENIKVLESRIKELTNRGESLARSLEG
ncbi:MAG: prefoldin subunit alpha [Candidatus Thermoplasmatota archaeon]|nr:prefoldin subunit alpha [Candidatus Thermoplasmatota archaeon]